MWFFPVGAAGSGSGNMSAVLVPGDVVEVVEGDLTNLQGKVLSVEGDTVTILPRHEDLKVSLGLSLAELLLTSLSSSSLPGPIGVSV